MMTTAILEEPVRASKLIQRDTSHRLVGKRWQAADIASKWVVFSTGPISIAAYLPCC